MSEVRPKPWWRLLLLLALALALLAVFGSGIHRYLSLDQIKGHQAELAAAVARAPAAAAATFFVIYVVVAAVAIPGAAPVLTLLSGALFGLFCGTILSSFASTLGATVSFLGARYLFRDLVQRRFAGRGGASWRRFDAGIAREGAFYLFALRLVPVIPFIAINVLAGLTALPTWTFYWVSQAGMLAGTVVYVNAGQRLAQVESLSGLFTPALIASFALLAAVPLAGRGLVAAIRKRRAAIGCRRPRRFDRNLIVIGAGAAGLISALIGTTTRARVTLIERATMGGDCLNTGCVPSKALLRTAALLAAARDSRRLGIARLEPTVRFAEVMARIRQVIERIAPNDSIARYEALGVEVVSGSARLVDPWTVAVGERQLTARAIVIATGARPRVPSIPGLAQTGYLTSETVWSLPSLPGRLLVVGGGAVGCELALAFARLGSAVTLVEQAPRLLASEEAEVSDLIERRFADEGITVRTHCQPLRFEVDCAAADGGEGAAADGGDGAAAGVGDGDGVGDGAASRPVDDSAMRFVDGPAKRLIVAGGPAGAESIAFDTVLIAIGRQPDVDGLGLERIGIDLRADGAIVVDGHLRTRHRHILACGDVVGQVQLTHAASHMAWYASVNALFGGFWRQRIDWSVLPRCIFTDPEIARVGLTEHQAVTQGIAFEVTRHPVAALDRAVTDGVEAGFVKVLTTAGSDRILGVTIAAAHAGEMIAEFALAMRHGLGLKRIMATVHAYPTMNEANRAVAAAWRRAHAPAGVLRWLERFHRWRLR